MQLTATQVFHHRWSAALAAQDAAALRGLYRDDAVQLSVGTGRTLVGAEAIAAGYAEVFGVVGGITTTGVESFTDLGTAYVAESRQTSGFAQALAYDVFALHDGRARYHVSGSITPRTATALPAESATPGQVFYRRMWEAKRTRNAAAIAGMLTPDAVQATVRGVLRGGPAIVQGEQRAWQYNADRRLRGLSAFVEGPNVLAAEGVVNVTLLETPFDMEFYEVWLLRDDGPAALNVSGLINPRPEELKQRLQRIGAQQAQAVQTVAYGIARTIGPWRW
ncbi:MAG TPA: nuclear transport factor 2 family protein [Actinospica sp.]|jgi:ketosteroid isomerase-like protein|nr:nuclear transport factor 2 family protein [Actinospica sp.]